MLGAILNKSWRQHPTRRQLYGHLPPITKTIQVRRARHAGHCWRSKDELVSDVLLWTPTYGQAKAGRPARTYIQQLCEDTGCNPEDLPEAMNDREKWREMVEDIRAGGMTWWWWWWWYIYICVCVCVCVVWENFDITLSHANDSSPLQILCALLGVPVCVCVCVCVSNTICPWCNGYGRRKWTRRHEFKSWTRLIAFHIALIPLGKVWIQLFSLQLWANCRAD